MRALVLFLLVAACGVVAVSLARESAPAPGSTPREPAVSGRRYTAEAARLEKAVGAFLADAVEPRRDRPLALVAPHAGYVFSGQIAADAWNQASRHSYGVIVLLGTNHTVPPFSGAAIDPHEAFRTPLGLASIDRESAAALVAADPAFTLDAAPHTEEHSVEVQVPFAQRLFPTAKILPIVVGSPDPQLCARLGGVLAKVLEERRPLFVASSDLSHYPDHANAVASDGAVLKAMASVDPTALRSAVRDEMRRGRPRLSTCACGEAPILVAMAAARALGATRGIVVSYANSGETALGEPSRVVGYGAVSFVPGPGSPDVEALARPDVSAAGAEIGAAERKALLRIARESIRRYLETGTAPLVRGVPPALRRNQGAFVTLRKAGSLRGCIGHTEQDLPLGQVVGAMALRAAFDDRRFQPLAADEFSQVEIEVSVLTPLVPIGGPEAIVLGRDGVVVRKAGRTALFLPEVAVEQGWTRDEMLEHLCRKAGLPPDAWRSGAEFLTFRTIAIREKDEG